MCAEPISSGDSQGLGVLKIRLKTGNHHILKRSLEALAAPDFIVILSRK